MNAIGSQIKRPGRWDEPFDETISDEDVFRLKQLDPFRQMDPDAFSRAVPLEGILKNDCRLLDLEKGDIIVREGDYGNSAFLILDGNAIVSLVSLPAEVLGRKESRRLGWLESIAKLWKNSPHRESRDYAVQLEELSYVGAREDEQGTRIFLHDIPRVIPQGRSVELHPGEIFGEISALTRTPRSATVVAGSKMLLLEIRWQGFRDLLNRQPTLRKHVETLYRENSLRSHLREIELLKYLTKEDIEALAEETVFESYGDFRWNKDFKSISRKDISERILSEPVIAAEGDYVNGLLLIRNGFARLSREHGDGHQTIAYLGKGEVYGLRELVANSASEEQQPYMLSLRALGYVDILRIPTPVFERLVLPKIPAEKMPPVRTRTADSKQRRAASRGKSMDAGLMEFLVENRFINGTMGMMIDLNRCTRCDDCVRACAATHNNNPRFVRQGKKHDNWMIANACMHCLDPVCMIGCPTGAIHRDSHNGLVVINDKTCIGCGTCSASCPYTNIQMVEISDRKGKPFTDGYGKPIVKATKCDLCSEHAGGPACQRACPHDALLRVDLSTASTVTSITTRT
ncbi:MAG: cyclic nucleotide-binding domain-containing protein [Planctomycetota bacterium]